MTQFGGKFDRATAFTLAARNVGRLLNLDEGVALIGFTRRELKRRDVAPLISGQQIKDVCTDFQPFWFQARIWFQIGNTISEPEWKVFERQHEQNWVARYGSSSTAPEEGRIQGEKMADIDERAYRASVKRGKAACAAMGGQQWVLGDEAATVTKVYGENRLEQFAEDINFPGEVCTLARIRSVCLAFPKTGARALYFAAAKILQGHPDRIQIVTANPNINRSCA